MQVAITKTVTEEGRELAELLRDYAKQETIEPLAKLKHYLGFGIPGAILLALGVYLISLGILRGMQHLAVASGDGFGSLLPLLASSAFLLAVSGVCIAKARRSMAGGGDPDRRRPAETAPADAGARR